jgi:hypothetical protein
MVRGTTRSGRRVTVHFGATGYQDFTQHKDPVRKARYIQRHARRERWGKDAIDTAGFWSRWLLWNRPSLRASMQDLRRRFGIKLLAPRVSSRAAFR